MTITAEHIEQSNQFGQQTTDLMAMLLRQNIVLTSLDNEKSITQKIDVLTLIRENLVKNIDIETLPTDKDELIFMDLISSITEQIQIFEVIIGRKNFENLRRIGRRFGQKYQQSIDLVS